MSTKRVPANTGNIPLRLWWRHVGTDVVKDVCRAAEIEFDSFKHVAAGRRRMGIDTARKFAAAAGDALSIDVLTPPKESQDRQAAAD